ncbi:hypothetical protein LNQ49_16755 [Flavobacterium sp. F-65]|uniref:Uncharacterized protein n=1 Tax=Flavobacterium pisciphilum TaxID=2893755 RepID=A0ABS8MWS1_9FLAO|nr:hypothetical protein [Flavobacterium sp. F-65]MCC9073229.1 hypothetical protein [Flavobacterium sp. F-65]
MGNTIELNEVVIEGNKNTYVPSGEYGPTMQLWGDDNKFMNGLSNTTFGVIATITAVSAIPETFGASGLALPLTIGQISIGISQMADSFNDKPSDVLHKYASIPGLIAGQSGNKYAPLIDVASVWAVGSVSSPKLLGNYKGTLNAFGELSRGQNVLFNGISIYSTYGTLNSGVSSGVSIYKDFTKE